MAAESGPVHPYSCSSVASVTQLFVGAARRIRGWQTWWENLNVNALELATTGLLSLPSLRQPQFSLWPKSDFVRFVPIADISPLDASHRRPSSVQGHGKVLG